MTSKQARQHGICCCRQCVCASCVGGDVSYAYEKGGGGVAPDLVVPISADIGPRSKCNATRRWNEFTAVAVDMTAGQQAAAASCGK